MFLLSVFSMPPKKISSQWGSSVSNKVRGKAFGISLAIQGKQQEISIQRGI